MENNYSVYVHTSPSGKRYVGMTCKKPMYRWNGGKGYNHNPYFTSEIEKYGWECFTHQVLIDGLNKCSAEQLEKQFIERWETTNKLFGYNCESGGVGNNKLSMETRKKISASNLGKKMSEEAKRKIGDARRGKPLSEEHKAKLSKSHKGNALSAETREKLSKSHKGKNCKSVVMVDSETGNDIRTFASLTEASAYVHGDKRNISAVTLGKREHAYGYKWRNNNNEI